MADDIKEQEGVDDTQCRSVSFYYTWWDDIKDCDAETGWTAVKAILNYGFSHTLPTDEQRRANPALKYGFSTICYQIDNKGKRKRNSAKGGKNHRGNQHTQGASDTSTSGVGAGQQGNAQAEAVIVDAPINAGTASGATSSANVTAQMQTTQAAAMPNTSMTGGGCGGTGDIYQNYETLRTQWNDFVSQVHTTKPIHQCGFTLDNVKQKDADRYSKVVGILQSFTVDKIMHNMQNYFNLRHIDNGYDSSKIDGKIDTWEFVGFLCAGWQKFSDRDMKDYEYA